jgi:hypothetical protein
MRPYGFNLDLYVDAGVVSLFRREPDENLDSFWSQTGLILLFCGCPMLWKFFLQTEISMPTLEAEYSALSNALKTLLPLKRIIIEALNAVKVPKGVVALVGPTFSRATHQPTILLQSTSLRIKPSTSYSSFIGSGSTTRIMSLLSTRSAPRNSMPTTWRRVSLQAPLRPIGRLSKDGESEMYGPRPELRYTCY